MQILVNVEPEWKRKWMELHSDRCHGGEHQICSTHLEQMTRDLIVEAEGWDLDLRVIQTSCLQNGAVACGKRSTAVSAERRRIQEKLWHDKLEPVSRVHRRPLWPHKNAGQDDGTGWVCGLMLGVRKAFTQGLPLTVDASRLPAPGLQWQALLPVTVQAPTGSCLACTIKHDRLHS